MIIIMVYLIIAAAANFDTTIPQGRIECGTHVCGCRSGGDTAVARASAGNTFRSATCSTSMKWGFAGSRRHHRRPRHAHDLCSLALEPRLPVGWLKYPNHCGYNNRCDGHDCGEDLCYHVKTKPKLCGPLKVPTRSSLVG